MATSNIGPHRRKLVLERDLYACVFCGSEDDLTIDHIIKRENHGTSEVSNLRTLCIVCHTEHHLGKQHPNREKLRHAFRNMREKNGARARKSSTGTRARRAIVRECTRIVPSVNKPLYLLLSVEDGVLVRQQPDAIFTIAHKYA